MGISIWPVGAPVTYSKLPIPGSAAHVVVLLKSAGVNCTRFNYNYFNQLQLLSLCSITITFYQLQLHWDGNESDKLKTRNFNLFTAAGVEF